MKSKLKDDVIEAWYQTQQNYPKPAPSLIQELFREAKSDYRNRKCKRPVMKFKFKPKGRRYGYDQRYSVTILDRIVLYPPRDQKEYLIQLVGGNLFGL